MCYSVAGLARKQGLVVTSRDAPQAGAGRARPDLWQGWGQLTVYYANLETSSSFVIWTMLGRLCDPVRPPRPRTSRSQDATQILLAGRPFTG